MGLCHQEDGCRSRPTIGTKNEHLIKAGLSSAACGTSHPRKHSVDGGWAWAVLAGVFGVHFLTFGYIRSFGILFLEFQTKFKSSSAMTAVIIGVQFCTYSLSNLLVVNWALKRISVRQSCLIGSLLECLGVLLNGLVPDIKYVVLTQGVIFGLGQALLYCPVLIIISQYFEARRALVTAISTCGASAGGLVLPPVIRHLVDSQGLAGGLLLLAGIMLHQAVFACLFTPISKYNSDTTVPVCTKSEGGTEHEKTAAGNINGSNLNLRMDNKEFERQRVPDEAEEAAPFLEEQSNTSNLSPVSRTLEGGVMDSHTCSEQERLLHLKVRDSSPQEGLEASGSRERLRLDSAKRKQSLRDTILESLSASASSLNLSGSLLEVRPRTVPGHLSLGDTPAQTRPKDENSHRDEESRAGPSKRACRVPEILKVLPFWLLLVFFACGGAGSALPAIFLPALAQEKGFPDQITFLLMISAVTELLGRLSPGLILHAGWMRPSSIQIVPLAACATLYQFTKWFNDFHSLVVMSVFGGFFTGIYWPVQSLVIIELFGMSQLGPLLGFYLLVTGLSITAINPICGFLRDISGSYVTTFHFFGVLYYMAVAMMVAVQFIRWNRKSAS